MQSNFRITGFFGRKYQYLHIKAFSGKKNSRFHLMKIYYILGKEEYAFAKKQNFITAHTGGAVGASSVLLIFPTNDDKKSCEKTIPKGVVVAIICNMQNVGLFKLAQDVAKTFEKLPVNENQYKVRKLYHC